MSCPDYKSVYIRANEIIGITLVLIQSKRFNNKTKEIYIGNHFCYRFLKYCLSDTKAERVLSLIRDHIFVQKLPPELKKR